MCIYTYTHTHIYIRLGGIKHVDDSICRVEGFGGEPLRVHGWSELQGLVARGRGCGLSLYGSFPKLLFPKGGNLYRAPYYTGNPNIGPRIIGNLDQYPYDA